MVPFVKERQRAPKGSIPAALGMFESEVNFYREIAPFLDMRVPACFSAELTSTGTRIELEDLSAWAEGADPLRVAAALRDLHQQWEPDAATRWPWLRRAGLASDLIGALYDREWPVLAARHSLSGVVAELGAALVGKVEAVELAEAAIQPHTLVHGDAATSNMRTGPGGEIAFLDWEDVRLGPGVSDLAWLLVSSVDPDAWDDVIDEYGDATHLADAMPAAVAQGFFSLAAHAPDTEQAARWQRRLAKAAGVSAGGP